MEMKYSESLLNNTTPSITQFKKLIVIAEFIFLVHIRECTVYCTRLVYRVSLFRELIT